jgi:hypothetical protein
VAGKGLVILNPALISIPDKTDREHGLLAWPHKCLMDNIGILLRRGHDFNMAE